MSDNLERFILQNREQFDILEPSPNVWNRVVKRKPTRLLSLDRNSAVWKVAAAVIIFLSAFFLQEYLHRDAHDSALATTPVESEIIIPELVEAEVYYTSEVNSKLKQVEKLLSANPELTEDIKNDFQELDSIYSGLKSDLKDGIARAEIIDAMIHNYRLKLMILEDLLEELQQTDKAVTVKKQNKNDKTQYQL